MLTSAALTAPYQIQGRCNTFQLQRSTYCGNVTAVETGTAYELAALEALKPLHMDCERVGGAHDGGVDLLGKWKIGNDSIRVVVQCKRQVRWATLALVSF